MNHPAAPNSAFKRIRRFQHIVNVLVKHGFGDGLTRIRVWENGAIERRFFHREPRLIQLTPAQRLRMVFEELGPTFIKLGQVLSTRPDLIPAEFIAELKKLQYSVQFLPVPIIKQVIESELKRPISEIFDSFDDTPLAAASLAQVHRAVLHGEPVVLKVQRPNIIEITELDIEILHNLANLAERYSPRFYLINPVGLVDEFAHQIRRELDFCLEVDNMRRFSQNFAEDKTIKVPAAYPELCTRRVITMEYLNGINISDSVRLRDEGYDLKLIARRGAIIGFKATFDFGFFHADPHPGNIFVMPGNVIGLVDYGMMAVFTNRDCERLSKLVYYISVRDEKRVARALNELMESEDVISAEELEPSMSTIIKEFGEISSDQMRLAGMLFSMMRAIMEHGARLRPQLLWLTKSIAVQEDIARSLNADFNLIDLAQPFARRTLTRKINPWQQRRELYYWLIDSLDLIREMPYDASVILREIRKGRIKIEFEHVGLEPIRRTMDSMANRSSLTNIIVALLISSSVIVLSDKGPTVGDFSTIGLVGYIIAAILAIILIISILREKK